MPAVLLMHLLTANFELDDTGYPIRTQEITAVCIMHIKLIFVHPIKHQRGKMRLSIGFKKSIDVTHEI